MASLAMTSFAALCFFVFTVASTQDRKYEIMLVNVSVMFSRTFNQFAAFIK